MDASDWTVHSHTHTKKNSVKLGKDDVLFSPSSPPAADAQSFCFFLNIYFFLGFLHRWISILVFLNEAKCPWEMKKMAANDAAVLTTNSRFRLVVLPSILSFFCVFLFSHLFILRFFFHLAVFFLDSSVGTRNANAHPRCLRDGSDNTLRSSFVIFWPFFLGFFGLNRFRDGRNQRCLGPL